MLPTERYRPLFAQFEESCLIDRRLLEAQALVESSGKAQAFRYEVALHDASYGLMQVLGKTARKLGLPSTEAEASLCDPATGILYGTKALIDICRWVGPECEKARSAGMFRRIDGVLPASLRTVYARYNGGGHNNPAADGSLRNEDYVQRIETFFEAVRREVP